MKLYNPCGKKGGSKDNRVLLQWDGDTHLRSALILLRSGGRVHWAVVVDRSCSTDHWFGVRRGLGRRRGDTAVTPVDLHQWLRRGAGVRGSTEWAATWQMANGRLCPTLALDWNAGGGAEILLELVGVARVCMGGRAGERDASLTPGLSGVLVLSRAELASCLRLLLEALLLLGVGVSDLDLHLLAARLHSEIVEVPDDIFARLTRLEANHVVSNDDDWRGGDN